jgi:hypothetical protein
MVCVMSSIVSDSSQGFGTSESDTLVLEDVGGANKTTHKASGAMKENMKEQPDWWELNNPEYTHNISFGKWDWQPRDDPSIHRLFFSSELKKTIHSSHSRSSHDLYSPPWRGIITGRCADSERTQFKRWSALTGLDLVDWVSGLVNRGIGSVRFFGDSIFRQLFFNLAWQLQRDAVLKASQIKATFSGCSWSVVVRKQGSDKDDHINWFSVLIWNGTEADKNVINNITIINSCPGNTCGDDLSYTQTLANTAQEFTAGGPPTLFVFNWGLHLETWGRANNVYQTLATTILTLQRLCAQCIVMLVETVAQHYRTKGGAYPSIAGRRPGVCCTPGKNGTCDISGNLEAGTKLLIRDEVSPQCSMPYVLGSWMDTYISKTAPPMSAETCEQTSNGQLCNLLEPSTCSPFLPASLQQIQDASSSNHPYEFKNIRANILLQKYMQKIQHNLSATVPILPFYGWTADRWDMHIAPFPMELTGVLGSGIAEAARRTQVLNDLVSKEAYISEQCSESLLRRYKEWNHLGPSDCTHICTTPFSPLFWEPVWDALAVHIQQ